MLLISIYINIRHFFIIVICVYHVVLCSFYSTNIPTFLLSIFRDTAQVIEFLTHVHQCHLLQLNLHDGLIISFDNIISIIPAFTCIFKIKTSNGTFHFYSPSVINFLIGTITVIPRQIERFTLGCVIIPIIQFFR